jgi:cyclase
MRSFITIIFLLFVTAQTWADTADAGGSDSATVTTRVQEKEVTIRADRVAPGIYFISGAGGNMGLCIGDDGAFLIDDQYAPLTEGIRQVIAQLTDKPVKFVLNTHWHGDHTGGNEALGDLGAVIIAHDNVRLRMSSEQFSTLWNRSTPPSAPGALPIVTFSDSVTFHVNGMNIRAFHVASAHTDGDTIVHFTDANVIHMGDVFFYEWYPYIDISAGGSVRGTIAAVDMVLPLIDGDTVVIPGHGASATDRRNLVAYRDMLETVADRIQAMIDEGKTLEEVQAVRPTAEWDEVWGQQFMKPDNFVRQVYGDLSGTL